MWSGFPRSLLTRAHASRRLLTLRLNTCSLFTLFTIFSLIYSVIAEFFGTKAPTVEELRAKKKYLEETAGVLQDIRTLEEKHRKPSLIQRAKEAAKEVRLAVKEVTANADDLEDDSEGEDEDESEGKGAGEDAGGHAAQPSDTTTSLNLNNAGGHTAKNAGTGVSKTAALEMASAGSGERLSVTVKEAAALLHLSESYVRELRHTKKLRSPGRNKKLILMSSITRYQNEHQKAGGTAGEPSSPTAAYQAFRHGNGNRVTAGEHPLHDSEYNAAQNREPHPVLLPPDHHRFSEYRGE